MKFTKMDKVQEKVLTSFWKPTMVHSLECFTAPPISGQI